MYRKRKYVFVILSMALLLILVSACGNQGTLTESKDNTNDRIVKDAMSDKVKIPSNPQRVLAPYLEDSLTVLGIKPAAQWSIGATVQDYLQPSLKDVPKIGWDLPVESVTSYNPDLIIFSSPAAIQKGQYETYSKIAPTYVFEEGISQDWRQQLRKMGEIFNKSELAETALKNYDNKAAKAKEDLRTSIGDQKAAIIWLTAKQFYLVEETRFSGKVLYGDLGVTKPSFVANLPKAKASWDPISLEKLSALDADHIFLIKKKDEAGVAELLDSAIWKGLPAVKNGRVYEFNDISNWTNNGLKASEKTVDEIISVLKK